MFRLTELCTSSSRNEVSRLSSSSCLDLEYGQVASAGSLIRELVQSVNLSEERG